MRDIEEKVVLGKQMDLWISTLVSKSSTAHAVSGTNTLPADGENRLSTHGGLQKRELSRSDEPSNSLADAAMVMPGTKGSPRSSSLKRVEIRRLCSNDGG